MNPPLLSSDNFRLCSSGIFFLHLYYIITCAIFQIYTFAHFCEKIIIFLTNTYSRWIEFVVKNFFILCSAHYPIARNMTIHLKNILFWNHTKTHKLNIRYITVIKAIPSNRFSSQKRI